MNEDVRRGMVAMLGDDPALLDELYGDFVGEVRKALAVPEPSSAAGGGFAAARAAAHTLKGCAANIGAERFRVLACEWQLAAEAEDASRCAAARAALLPLAAAL